MRDIFLNYFIYFVTISIHAKKYSVSTIMQNRHLNQVIDDVNLLHASRYTIKIRDVLFKF